MIIKSRKYYIMLELLTGLVGAGFLFSYNWKLGLAAFFILWSQNIHNILLKYE